MIAKYGRLRSTAQITAANGVRFDAQMLEIWAIEVISKGGGAALTLPDWLVQILPQSVQRSRKHARLWKKFLLGAETQNEIAQATQRFARTHLGL